MDQQTDRPLPLVPTTLSLSLPLDRRPERTLRNSSRSHQGEQCPKKRKPRSEGGIDERMDSDRPRLRRKCNQSNRRGNHVDKYLQLNEVESGEVERCKFQERSISSPSSKKKRELK